MSWLEILLLIVVIVLLIVIAYGVYWFGCIIFDLARIFFGGWARAKRDRER